MCPLKLDLLSVNFDSETAKIRSVIVTQHSAAITLQPSKLRHNYFVYIMSIVFIVLARYAVIMCLSVCLSEQYLAISLYARNGARYDHSYYGMLIGTRMCSYRIVLF